eukprot:6181370-Pleurochrysis_carterae.AAC.1
MEYLNASPAYPFGCFLLTKQLIERTGCTKLTAIEAAQGIKMMGDILEVGMHVLFDNSSIPHKPGLAKTVVAHKPGATFYAPVSLLLQRRPARQVEEKWRECMGWRHIRLMRMQQAGADSQGMSSYVWKGRRKRASLRTRTPANFWPRHAQACLRPSRKLKSDFPEVP